MSKRKNDASVRMSGLIINIVSILLGITTAYFLTIQSLKIEIASKADSIAVGLLDKKLANIEVMLKEGVLNKEQFYKFTKDIEIRLTRIEYYLSDQSDEQRGES